MVLQELLNEVVLDTHNTQKMFALAKEYDRLEQGAAAATFYLRAADYEYEDKELQYKSLIQLSKIYYRAKGRWQSARSIMENAVGVLPQRPEAYYFLAKWHQDMDQWRPSLMYSGIGLSLKDQNDLDVDYPGMHGIKYLNALALWKDNGKDQGKQALFNLKYKDIISDKDLKTKVNSTLDTIGYPSSLKYNREDKSLYKFPFKGLGKVTENYARHFQDMFVLSVLDGKERGSFIELGSGEPFTWNATALLEKTFGWKGISVDINEKTCYKHAQTRNSTIITGNAEEIDYEALLKSHCMEEHIDFLRINCEEASLKTLLKIPFNRYEFSVIQFQHNSCWWGEEIKTVAREHLEKAGYILCANDIALDDKQTYEDWWVHPSYFKKHMKTSNEESNFVWDYMMHGFMEM